MDKIYIYKQITKDTKIGDITKDLMDNIKEYNIKTDVLEKIEKVVYEAEKNIKLYADSGEIEINIYDNILKARFRDKGPGIENIGLAFEEGFTTANNEMKEKGYGLGRGLSVIQDNSDTLNIASEIGVGTTIDVEINLI